ncbi:MAG: right-handed parallel beta-helix repeat-containing protein [Pirellulaceae bacterium]|jgi:parallel beta-helix repeat protein|nr:right-handed parallel beta-helix repeat-containing protein [Pirellulaceae bacterium]
MKSPAFVVATITLTVLCGGSSAADQSLSPVREWFPSAPPLPNPTGHVIKASTVNELFQAARDVKPGGTILLADGHYMMPRYFELRTDGVTLRSKSGQRERVVIDGAHSRHGELIGVSACSGVTIADLTIQNIKYNGFKINSNTGVQRCRIYNCVIHNIWQRGIKAVGVPKQDREKLRPKNCRVEYCLFYNDRPKRFSDDPTDTVDTFGGNYIGGMDVMYATGWTISENVFVGIRGRTGAARGGIFVWVDSRDCTIERNIVIDCDTGICLGNSHRGKDTRIHCTRCVVRNNFVSRAPETGILADYTQDCTIVHNTIHDPDSRLKRLIRLVHDNDGLLVANNLLSGPPMRRASATGMLRIKGNLTRLLTDAFVSARDGNLHLRESVSGVVDAAEPVEQVTHDIDGEQRTVPPDIGADEFTDSHKTLR